MSTWPEEDGEEGGMRGRLGSQHSRAYRVGRRNGRGKVWRDGRVSYTRGQESTVCKSLVLVLPAAACIGGWPRAALLGGHTGKKEEEEEEEERTWWQVM